MPDKEVSAHPEPSPQLTAQITSDSSLYYCGLRYFKATTVACHAEAGIWTKSVYLRVPYSCLNDDVDVGDYVDMVLVMPSGIAVLVTGVVYKKAARSAQVYIPRTEYRHLVEELKRARHVLIQLVRKWKKS
jgi:hypothetical protein